MFHIVIHCKPKENNEEYFGKVKGAYASILLDYKDYDGVLQLSKFYINEEGWDFIEFDKEYFTFEAKEDLPEDYQKYYDELNEFGYSIIFNMYNEEDGE
jgi:hypothetical protein